MGGNNEFFENFERNKYLKKLPSMQRVKVVHLSSLICLSEEYPVSEFTDKSLVYIC